MEQPINLESLYNQLKRIENAMITRREIDNFLETIAVLSNSSTMKQINSSEKEILGGHVKEINSASDL